MRTESGGVMRTALLGAVWIVGTLAGAAASAQEAGGADAAKAYGADWQTWQADTDVTDMASVQRGARNYVSYCMGCHSLKYEHWSRLGQDLGIPPAMLEKDLLPPGDKTTDYILTSMPAADAAAWFGKTPPDLSLMVRARPHGYVYQFLKTFYVDPTRPTAMPHVLSELEGLKGAVYRQEPKAGGGTEQVFDHFVTLTPGRLSAAEYDGFVRDTVNFLDYVSDPTQTARRNLGVWVLLFLLVFTWLAWLVKREYWKDVH
jgi:ubiquinol-cytochrome c reductase cytochrome c1 subunit